MRATSRLIPGMGLVLLLQVIPNAPWAQTTATGTIDPQAAQMLRDVADPIKAADTINLTLSSELHMHMGDMKQDMQATFTASIQGQNKIAFEVKDGDQAGSIVCNGTTLTMFSLSANSYVQMPIEDNLRDVLLKNGFTSMLSGITALIAEDPYDDLMDGVTSATYLGVTTLNGVKARHAIFDQERIEWQAWVSDSPTTPVLLRMHNDMKMPSANSQGNKSNEASKALSNMKLSITVDFSDWKFNEPIAGSVFEFTPPADATDMTEAMTAGPDEEDADQAHPLLGRPAPALSLNLLDGSSVKADELTSTVVVLDFWASWCGPCRRALPIVDKVAASFADQPVRFFAVNMDESTDTIKTFVEETKLKLPIAMDKGELGKAFKINSIPTTFLIGTDGKVQAVHEGLSPNAEEELTSQVKALLRGETLADEPTTPTAQETEAGDTESTAPELQTAWSLPGTWTSAGYDPGSKVIIALANKGAGATVSPDGKKTGDFKAKGADNELFLAQLNATPELEILTFGSWGSAVRAFSTTGEQLWEKAGGQGIDDVWAGDLNGDGLDEVVIGYNGGTGLHAVTRDGKPLWEYTRTGNVWHVCVGNVTADDTPEVITTSAAGKVHIYDAAGKKIKDITPRLYATMVRVATRTDKPTLILVGGSTRSGETLAAYDIAGKEHWTKVLKGKSSNIDSAAVSPDGEMVAVGLRGGTVLVLDTNTGETIGKATNQVSVPNVNWATDLNQQPILLSTTGDQLNAFIVKPGEHTKN